jgi:hypothetical protein
MRKLSPSRVFKCQALNCKNVMRAGDRWLIAVSWADGRLTFEKFRDLNLFELHAEEHGARVICSEVCADVHFQRWFRGSISAADEPAGPSPAVFTEDRLICWVSDVYKDTGRFGEARIINFRDNGQKRQVYCFRPQYFAAIEKTAGLYATFLTEKKRKDGTDYVNVVKLISASASPNKGKILARNSKAHHGDTEARRNPNAG